MLCLPDKSESDVTSPFLTDHARQPLNTCARMTLIVVFTFIAWALSAAQTPSPIWTTLPGAAMDVGANAKGDVWVIGTNPVQGGFTIFRWVNGNWQNIPGGALRISVDTDGTAWIVNSTHQIFHSDANAQWTMAPGGATDIGVGANGDVWIIGSNQSGNDYDIWHAVFAPGTRTVTGWQRVDGGAVRIAVGPDGAPWVVNSSGNVFYQLGGGWAQLAINGIRDVSIGPDGTPYLVAGGSLLRLIPNPMNAQSMNQAATAWIPGAIPAGGAVNVAAGAPGTLYITKDNANGNAILSSRGLPVASPTLSANATPWTPPASSPSSSSTTSQAGLQAFDFCWRDTRGRGAGQPLSMKSSDCPAGTVKDPHGLLCYPPCKAGYSMVGPVCWENCPSGFTDTGADCAKPNTSYGRGAGYGLLDIGRDQCNKENSQGCEQWAGTWYPKCQTGYHAVGCCVCSSDCADMTDTGAFCHKNSYGNTAGQVLGCSPGLELSGLLCYQTCGPTSDGVGPVCWDHCPSGWVQCGAGCAKSTEACASAIQNQIITVVTAAAQIASEVLTAGATAGIMEAKVVLNDAGKPILKATDMAGKTMDLTKVSDAAAQAKDMVGKLNFTQAVKNFPKAGISTDTVNAAIRQTAKESLIGATKQEMVTKAIDKGSEVAAMINTFIGVSNDPTLNQDQKNFQIAQAVLETASLADPTGLMGVVAAYTKPLCSLVAQPTQSSSIVDLDDIDRQKVRGELMGNQ